MSALKPQEIEKRNAAAAFVTSREGGLALLMRECGSLLNDPKTGIDAVARAWNERNGRELAAAYVWLDEYLSHLKATDGSAHRKASFEMSKALGDGFLHSARMMFERKPPDKASCQRAASVYVPKELDFVRLGKNPGYERFDEFAQTLKDIQTQRGYQIPAHLRLGFDVLKERAMSMQRVASLDAAEMARESGDGALRLSIFKNLATQGDGMASQQVGLMLLNGQGTERNPLEAYRWFYAAWSQSEFEGLNALGVLHRDGLIDNSNPLLAIAAFALVRDLAPATPARERARRNLESVIPLMTPPVRQQIACLKLSELDTELKRPIRGLAPLVLATALPANDPRLADLVTDFKEPVNERRCP